MNNGFIWLGISVLLLGIEAATVNLFTVWFGLGAIGAMIAALCGLGITAQILIFAVLSVVFLIFTRPAVKKFVKKTPTNSDSLIGQTALVTQDINNINAEGEVKIGGKYWTARTDEDGITIKKDDMVEIVSISGVKLIVKQTGN